MDRSELRVVEGRRNNLPGWLDLPLLVTARSPKSKHQNCQYRVSRTDSLMQAGIYARQSVLEFWSMIAGRPPYVPGISSNNPIAGELLCLADAHACFSGITRPFVEGDEGKTVLAYVLKPKVFCADVLTMACVETQKKVANDLVFVAYVRQEWPTREDRLAVHGVLTHWHFVEADEKDRYLPVDYESRYLSRNW